MRDRRWGSRLTVSAALASVCGMTRYWAFLSDPDGYHYQTLFSRGREVWDGVHGIPAQFQLRQVVVGDRVLLYHTAPLKSVYGIGRVVRAPYPDATDAKGKRVVVDLEPVETLAREVSLAELKADPVCSGIRFVRMARCAVSPVEAAQWKAVLGLAKKKAPR